MKRRQALVALCPEACALPVVPGTIDYDGCSVPCCDQPWPSGRNVIACSHSSAEAARRNIEVVRRPRLDFTSGGSARPTKKNMSRPLSPSLATSPVHKKVKTTHSSEGNFASGLFEPAYVEKLRSSYADSEPYKHAVVDALFRDDLLRDVKDEIIRELSFTEKETDIYRVHMLVHE